MKSDEMQRLRDRIYRLIELADESEAPEVKTDMACFACVLTSAMIEVACRQYVGKFVEKRASPQVIGFVERKLYFFQNPSMDNIDELLRAFDSKIADDFRDAIGDEGVDAINSVVNNKNQLAHGKGVGLGLATMKRYFNDVILSITRLANILGVAK